MKARPVATVTYSYTHARRVEDAPEFLNGDPDTLVVRESSLSTPAARLAARPSIEEVRISARQAHVRVVPEATQDACEGTIDRLWQASFRGNRDVSAKPKSSMPELPEAASPLGFAHGHSPARQVSWDSEAADTLASRGLSMGPSKIATGLPFDASGA